MNISNKICMFVNAPLAGGQRVFKEARTLVDAGYEVTILANQDPMEMSPIWDGIKVISVPRHPSPLFPGRFTLSWMKKVFALKPDLIHAHDLPTLGRAWIAARLLGSRLIYDSHDYYLETQFVLRMPWHRKKYYRAKEAFLIRRCDLVLHAVPGLCEIAGKDYKIPAPKWIANFPMGDSPPRSKILHEQFNLPPETKIVIYEGLVVKDRGLEELIYSARFLTGDEVIVILGEGYLKQELIELTRSLGVEDKVKFVDRIDQKDFPAYCAAADLGVAIYRNEGLSWDHGWSTKVFDYTRAGLPVILSGCKATKKIVSQHGLGIILDDPEPQKIAAAIREMFEDRIKYAEYSRKANAAWKNCFNWETEADKLLGFYKKLLAEENSNGEED